VRVIHQDLEIRRETVSGAIRATVDLNPTIVGVGFGYRF
jgi:outer membrane protein W